MCLRTSVCNTLRRSPCHHLDLLCLTLWRPLWSVWLLLYLSFYDLVPPSLLQLQRKQIYGSLKSHQLLKAAQPLQLVALLLIHLPSFVELSLHQARQVNMGTALKILRSGWTSSQPYRALALPNLWGWHLDSQSNSPSQRFWRRDSIYSWDKVEGISGSAVCCCLWQTFAQSPHF